MGRRKPRSGPIWLSAVSTFPTVFVKMSAETTATRMLAELAQLGMNEARFYSELSSKRSRVLKAHGSGWDSLSGCPFPSRTARSSSGTIRRRFGSSTKASTPTCMAIPAPEKSPEEAGKLARELNEHQTC